MKKTKKKSKKIKIKEKALTLNEVFSQVSSSTTASPSFSNVALTPLSSEACLRHGINPDALKKRDFESFREGKDMDLEIQRLKYESYEQRRYELMKTATEEREKLMKHRLKGDVSVASTAKSSTSLTPSAILKEEERATSTLLELEKKRLQKAKERQKME